MAKATQAEAAAFAELWRTACEEGIKFTDFAERLGLNQSSVSRRRLRTEAMLGIKLPSFTGSLGSKAAAETRRRLAARGVSPEHGMTHSVPDGYVVKGVSTLYNAEGEISGQWVKSNIDAERQEALIKESLEAMAEALPKLKPLPARGVWSPDLLTVYPIGDPHVGMYAWREESGEDWDLSTAERVHCAAMNALVASAPASDKALVLNLGDMFHYDSMAPITSRSGNMLDADGRYAKMVRVGVKIIRQCITSALQKHHTVRVVNVIGNHDETGAVWLAVALSHIYENEPRVEVETSPSVFSYYRFGNNLLGFHHGHSCKAPQLPGVMATDRAKDWGEVEHRYWYTGHVHHAGFKEFPGVSVESFGTLAAKDAYAANGGWRSRRTMTAIVIDKQYGEVARHMVHPDMLKAA